MELTNHIELLKYLIIHKEKTDKFIFFSQAYTDILIS